MAFSEGNLLLVGNFCANLDEKNADMVRFTNRWNWKWIFFLTSRILLKKACSYKCQFCTKVFASSSLLSHVLVMAWQNIKKKYLMCQIWFYLQRDRTGMKLWKNKASFAKSLQLVLQMSILHQRNESASSRLVSPGV